MQQSRYEVNISCLFYAFLDRVGKECSLLAYTYVRKGVYEIVSDGGGVRPSDHGRGVCIRNYKRVRTPKSVQKYRHQLQNYNIEYIYTYIHLECNQKSTISK